MKKLLIIFLVVFSSFLEAEEFEQFGLGVGISFSWDLGSDDRISDAQVVDGIVRVSDADNGLARIVLEGHYFFPTQSWWSHGPFILVQPGEEEIIDALGLGWMLGFKREKSDGNSFNLGLGFIADPNVKTLGDGIEKNQPLPGNETEVRFSEETQGGIAIVFSTSW